MEFIKEYWTQILFMSSVLAGLITFCYYMVQATKCSLRNDILSIFDRCESTKTITHYQLESIKHSFEIYKKLKGNSFVEEIVNKVSQFELVD